MSSMIRRVPRLALAAGALVFSLGLWAALSVLPEWRAARNRTPRLATSVRDQLASIGGRLSAGRVTIANGATSEAVERAYRRLGPAGAEWLLSSGAAAGVHVEGTLTVPGGGTGPTEVLVAPDGTPREFHWLPGGSQLQFVAPDAATVQAREAFCDRISTLLAGGAPLGPETTWPRANLLMRAMPLLSGEPREAVVRMSVAGSPMVMIRRELVDPDAARRAAGGFQKSLVASAPVFVLAIGTFVLFGMCLFRKRVSFRNALPIATFAFVAFVLGGFSPDETSSGVIALVAFVVWRVFLLFFLLVLWTTAESLLRDTVPGFTTSLDSFGSGRLVPRGGRAILGGLGFGAGLAGLLLGVPALAARSLAPEVRPDELTFRLPLLGVHASPFFEGPYHAAILVLLIALFRFALPRAAAGSAAALVFGLFLSLSAPLEPWGAALALGLATAVLLLLSFRTYGLAALLVASTSAGLLRDIAAGLRAPAAGLAPMLFCALVLAGLVVVGFVAVSRPEREDEGRVDAPEYVRKVESERRVKYEMDLLSRMQLAMLPDKPPEIAGLDIGVRSVLATEAGGDLYEFIEDGDGRLWIAAGDVSGHGYSCGIQGAMVKAALLSLVKAGRAPGEVLCEIDRVLRAARAGRLFTTLALLTIDPKTGRGVLANAGHPFPLLVADATCREVAGSGLPLGQGPERTYTDQELVIPEGGSLVFASDGLYEGPDRFDEPYGYDRPRTVLQSVGLWRRPAEAIVEALFTDWRLHVGDGAPADDTTVLVVKRPALAWS